MAGRRFAIASRFRIAVQQAIRLGIPMFSIGAHFKLMAKCTPQKLWL